MWQHKSLKEMGDEAQKRLWEKEASAKAKPPSLSPMPIITLSNGLRVGNLSSGHDFEFEDGSVLPACKADRVEAGKLEIVERSMPRMLHRLGECFTFQAIELTPKLAPACLEMLESADAQYLNDEVHIVIVPLMMLEAIKRMRLANRLKSFWDFAVVIRKIGRDVDGQRAKISIDRFCV